MIAAKPITGIEVREVRGVGWSIVTTWDGVVGHRHAIQPDREWANRYAQLFFAEVAEGIVDRIGVLPYLQLAEASDAHP